jgi:hypothetical protein
MDTNDIKALDIDTVKVLRCLSQKIDSVTTHGLTVNEAVAHYKCQFCTDKQFCDYLAHKCIEY